MNRNKEVISYFCITILRIKTVMNNNQNDYRIYDLKCLPLWEQIIKGHEFTKFRITIS
jgi:hypothetical protein